MRKSLEAIATTDFEVEFMGKITKALENYPRDLEARLVEYNRMLDWLNIATKTEQVSSQFYNLASAFVSRFVTVVFALRK